MKNPQRKTYLCLRFFLTALFGLSAWMASAQSTWYFDPLKEGGAAPDLNDLNLWNSQSDGQGVRPTEFVEEDTWLLNRRARAEGNYVFPVTLTSGGAAEIDPRARRQRPTIAGVVVPEDTLFLSEPRVDGTNQIMIDWLELGDRVRLRSHPQRPFVFGVRELIGEGNLLAGDGATGREEGIISLSITEASGFSGTIRFRNTTGEFVNDTDLRNARLHITQADDSAKTTTLILSRQLMVREVMLHSNLIDSPGTYSASDLNEFLRDERITIEDQGGSITVRP